MKLVINSSYGGFELSKEAQDLLPADTHTTGMRRVGPPPSWWRWWRN